MAVNVGSEGREVNGGVVGGGGREDKRRRRFGDADVAGVDCPIDIGRLGILGEQCLIDMGGGVRFSIRGTPQDMSHGIRRVSSDGLSFGSSFEALDAFRSASFLLRGGTSLLTLRLGVRRGVGGRWGILGS